MITDALNAFFSRATIVGAGPFTSDVIDLGPLFGAFRNMGRGQPLRLRVQVETAVTSGGSAALTVSYADSPNADGSGSTTRATYNASAGNPAAGTILVDVVLPDNLQRYLVLSVATSATTTAGVITAVIVEDSDSPTGQYGWAAQVLNF